MKAKLFALFVALLMVGCGESSDPSDPSDSSTTPEVLEDATADAVDWSKLQGRNGVMYLRSENTPFSGLGQSWYGRGRKEFELTLKDGKQDGLSTHWYDNGQKEAEITYKDGKQDGLWIIYNQEGTETGRETYKDGKPVSD